MTRNDQDRAFPSVSLTRIGLIVLVPVTLLLGVHTFAWAVTLKTWTAGETLTAADLNQNFANINTQLTAQPPCRAGFWSLGDGRLCMQMAMQPAAGMYDNGPTGAIHVCQGIGPGSRVCTFTDFRQACGAGLNPYAGITTGWYGDHAVITSTTAIGSMGDWDDEFGGWNFGDCTENNDAPAAQATSIAKQFRCCY
jgi:hypothetical protein